MGVSSCESHRFSKEIRGHWVTAVLEMGGLNSPTYIIEVPSGSIGNTLNHNSHHFDQISALYAVLYSKIQNYCGVPDRMGTVISAATSKNVIAVFTSLFFDFICFLVPWAVCKETLWIHLAVLKIWLWTWVQTNNQNLYRTFSGFHWFQFLFGHSRCSFFSLVFTSSCCKNQYHR